MPLETDRVVVISDLHMAAAGRGIFSAQTELAAFVDHLVDAPERLDLVILGDALDYLQVQPYLKLDAKTAADKTRDIVANNELVFAALKRLLRAGKRMRWCIGNHDLELAFASARKVLVDALVEPGDAAAEARLAIRTDGGRLEYALEGGGVLRLVHGNKGDPWNNVDYGALAEAAQAAEAAHADGGAEAAFPYPHGSKLVAEVLNPLKDDGFVHVDLLKPEQTVALPLTLALWPEQTRRYLAAAFPSFFEATVTAIQARLGRAFRVAPPRSFGDPLPPPPADPQAPVAVEDLLARAFSASLPAPEARDALQALLASTLWSDRGAQALATAVAAPPAPGKTFSTGALGDLASACFRGAAQNANVNSNLWSLETPDELDASVRGAFKEGALVVIAGHTHLARAISYPAGWYLNTGTWADLMRIPAYVQGTEFAAFARSLRELFTHPEQAPAELRPFKRLTFADIDLRPVAGGSNFRAALREWVPTPYRTLGAFP